MGGVKVADDIEGNDENEKKIQKPQKDRLFPVALDTAEEIIGDLTGLAAHEIALGIGHSSGADAKGQKGKEPHKKQNVGKSGGVAVLHLGTHHTVEGVESMTFAVAHHTHKRLKQHVHGCFIRHAAHACKISKDGKNGAVDEKIQKVQGNQIPKLITKGGEKAFKSKVLRYVLLADTLARLDKSVK